VCWAGWGCNHQPGPSAGQLDVVELGPIQERHQEVDSPKGPAWNQTRVLQHAQTTGSTDRAMASCGVLAPTMAACWIGTWQPTNSVKAVANMGAGIAKLRLLA